MRTSTVIRTLVDVGDDGRVVLRSGALAARRLPDEHSSVRVALVASEALLLAGDDVRLDVRVGAGLSLEIVETSGTVAYDMRGGRAAWTVDVVLGAGAALVWDGLPFVVATGADVARHTRVRLAPDARCTMRETLVSGRSGEAGGHMIATTHADVDGTPLLVECLEFGARSRFDPAILGGARCLDQVTTLGHRLADPAALQLDGVGSVYRTRGADTHSTRVTLADLVIHTTRH